VSATYHPGEIEVQERAGVRSMAERVGNSIHPNIPPAAREFLEEQPMVVVGSVGADGRVWASLLVGEPGFVRALDERTVRIAEIEREGDAQADLAADRDCWGKLLAHWKPLGIAKARIGGNAKDRVENRVPNLREKEE
jgi:predicted pyridoxine 5'-phosphate oxidase superfamily flavin-nucleotide-binding protein